MDLEEKLKEIINNDAYIMSILRAVESLKLYDSWVCAGIIRNKVWDVSHKCTTPLNDIDVIYYDRYDTSLETEKLLENKLEALISNQLWSVKNQARMHIKNGVSAYLSSYDGVANFPETPTAIAVKIQNEELLIMAPYGLHDLFHHIVRPTPKFHQHMELYKIYRSRMKEKQWHKIWPRLVIEK
ncbi:nucleotidyltransferase family protein [Lysinibacillus sp. LZ02]|uniref:nucleotidyltransferase family protein n=1 Tax=Lysinibacillus sp. LZ02 TaxID=3420668 RepID=UPI003D35F3FE